MNGVGSSLRSSESLAYFDRDSFAWKTLQLSLLPGEDSTESLDTLPTPGMTVNGKLYQRRAWERGISEDECSSSQREMWPTPVASDAKKLSSGSLSRAVRPDLKFCYRKTTGRDRHRPGGASAIPKATGNLNPEFAEWLMGFPIGWTELP